MQLSSIVALAGIFAAAIPGALGHAYIVSPEAYWPVGWPNNGWISTINGTLLGPLDFSIYGYGPEGNVKYFTANFPDSGYNSLKDFILANQEMYSADLDPVCGYTAYDDSKRSPMNTSLEYSGFTHAGPCEVWCDDEVVVFENDCQAVYPDIPAFVPLDQTKCANANELAIYWLGIHSDPWQVYSNCVWIEGGSGSGGSSTTTPAAETSTESSDVGADADDEYASTAASSATDDTSDATEAPSATSAATDAPVVEETEAPAAAVDLPVKCSVRRRRN